ncbi:MAG: 2'-5' RNA ligase family protein [Pseudomonadota bacterium]
MTKNAYGGSALQTSLPGFDAPSAPTDRLFFAIFPDSGAASQVDQLAEQLRTVHGLKGKPLQTERFHITLHHLGDFVGLPPHIVAMAMEAGASVIQQPFQIALDRAMSFVARPGKNPYVLLGGGDGVAELIGFQLALGDAMAKTGLKVGKTKSGYTPHVTLLYDEHSVAEHPVEVLNWTAREFVLVHSLLGQTKHVPLARWTLAPR